ncbi:MAG: molybdopterin molybdotransferase MoeA [Planctomycetes bacterium]|nr:molybdopterin molybdotransferase MoeA [Planctomycetota bacterium]
MMVTVDDALRMVLERALPLPVESVPLRDVQGRTLAEEVVADEDVPAFDRSTMDGYAANSGDMVNGETVLAVVEDLFAGELPRRALRRGEAARIMTGAPIPRGADCVVMVEKTRSAGPGHVCVRGRARPMQNLVVRGQFVRKGERLLPPGQVLRPADVSLLAFVGVASPRVYRAAECAVLSTGNELVEPEEKPGPGLIRNSNAYGLSAQCAAAGARIRFLGIGRDEPETLKQLVRQGLESDVLVTTGGASVGEKDLVGRILVEEGVEICFNRVAVKPGKPMWFGTRGRVLVFGLPGNPLSAMVTAELFVLPALRRLAGQTQPEPRIWHVRLGEGPVQALDRRQYLPARLRLDGPECIAQPVLSHGSGDLISIIHADGLVVIPEDREAPRRGDVVEFLPLALEVRSVGLSP